MGRALPELGGVEHRFVDLPNLRMHVAEAGEGDPVVLLHGWPQNWWAWRRLIPPLAERFRVVCPDLRGFGWSDAPTGGYEKETLADDILQLLDALELRRVRMIGHDVGGFVGFLTCLRAPERVAQ
jgi:pimeloyl-ACP methyl ester carboxylesterase